MIFSVLEHMKNYSLLFRKINGWLKPNAEARGTDGALFFAHIFCHRDTPYHFEEDDGWMSQMFFSGRYLCTPLSEPKGYNSDTKPKPSGGTMPSFDLFTYFQDDLVLKEAWWLNGNNYARTCEDWLKNQDANNKRNESIAKLEEDAIANEMKAEDGRVSFYRSALPGIMMDYLAGLTLVVLFITDSEYSS